MPETVSHNMLMVLNYNFVALFTNEPLRRGILSRETYRDSPQIHYALFYALLAAFFNNQTLGVTIVAYS